jgi:pentose-5-phosphate-3-epimerase
MKRFKLKYNNVIIAPSLFAANFANLSRDIAVVEKAGANVIVAGSAIFGAPDIEKAVKDFRDKCRI